MNKLYKLVLAVAALRAWIRFLRHFYMIRPSRSARKGFIFPETGGRPLTILETIYRTVTDLLLYDSIQFGQLVFVLMYPRVLGRVLWALLVPSKYIHRNISYKDERGRNHGRAVEQSSRRRLDIYCPEIPKLVDRPVILFIHGGAWAWGHKWEYSALGRNLTCLGAVVVVVNYRVYPLGDCSDMVEDVIDSILWTKSNIQSYGGNPRNLNVLGHSAGAHISAMAIASVAKRATEELATGKVRFPSTEEKWLDVLQDVNSFTGVSGVYDIDSHYSHESQRQVAIPPVNFTGVHLMSPMAPCMNGLDCFEHHSPLQNLDGLEHVAQHRPQLLPHFCFVHGELDKTSPASASREFHEELKRIGCDSKFIWLSEVLHVEPLLHLSLGFLSKADNSSSSDEAVSSSRKSLYTTLLHIIESNLQTAKAPFGK